MLIVDLEYLEVAPEDLVQGGFAALSVATSSASGITDTGRLVISSNSFTSTTYSEFFGPTAFSSSSSNAAVLPS